jgi:hypothetical protein
MSIKSLEGVVLHLCLQFQRTLKRFKWHSLGVILLLFVVHIGMFALIYSLLGAQETKVNHFSESGHGAAQIAQIATIATDIDIFLSNRCAVLRDFEGHIPRGLPQAIIAMSGFALSCLQVTADVPGCSAAGR